MAVTRTLLRPGYGEGSEAGAWSVGVVRAVVRGP